MNLELTRELLTAAYERPQGQYQVSGRDQAREVELLVEAGYVEASVQNSADTPSAVITRLTEAGQKLLRVLRQEETSKR